MGPKYQIFVSSTYEDLRDEREAVSWEILKIDHIPVGMENFSATDERGWRLITKIIDVSDYYILILAGRYGAIDSASKLSWTEREYNYALSKNIPVLVFIREESYIPGNMVDKGSSAKKLAAFIAKVKSQYLSERWTTADNLCKKISAALTKKIRDDLEENKPRPGWYRGGASGRPRIHEVCMRYYHVHMRAFGTELECKNGHCMLTYYGSGLIESPKAPVRFEDRVKGSQKILSCNMNPPAQILNPDEFKRNPTNLHYVVESTDSSPVLYINGEIAIVTTITPDIGGFGLHVPYRADRVTFVVDMSAIGFEPRQQIGARLVPKNEKGIATRRKDLVEASVFEDKKVWLICAKDVPPDSNVELSWGD